MHIRSLCLLLSFWSGACATGRTSDPPKAGPTKAPVAPVADSDDGADAEAPAVDPELNARYREEREVETWEKRFERQGREVADRKPEVLAALALEPGQTVADIGAGTGLYTLDLAKAVGPRGRVMAVDVQDYFLEHLAAEAEQAGFDNVQTVRATQKSVELAPGTVDLAFFCDAFHHVEYPKSYLATVFAALRPGGRLALIEFRRPDEQSVDPDGAWLREHIRASPEQFRREFEAAGFVFRNEHDLFEENFFYVFEKPQ
jgi:predicted methyltransferase